MLLYPAPLIMRHCSKSHLSVSCISDFRQCIRNTGILSVTSIIKTQMKKDLLCIWFEASTKVIQNIQALLYSHNCLESHKLSLDGP